MVVTTIIPRSEAELARKAGLSLLIYGRRKVGKTFIVKNFLEHDIYVMVKRGGGFHIEGFSPPNLDSYDDFIGLLGSWLKDGKRVVVDEFQRLPGSFLDSLQAMDLKGNLVLTGSSFHIVKTVLSPRSPVLGALSEVKVSLIKPLDILQGLQKHAPAEVAFGLSPYLRDPWTIPYFRGRETSLPDILLLSREAIRALIGEIFIEEDKGLSAVYEGVLRVLSTGKWKLDELADKLHSRRIIPKPDPHLIRPYFNNMESMDLVKRIPIFGKKEFKYILSSPVMEMGFMLDEKFDFFQTDISAGRVGEITGPSVPMHIERFCGELFAQIYQGVYNYFYSKDFDIDFIITRGKRAIASGEVKWTASPSRGDVEKFLDRTRHIPGDKIFFSKRTVDDPRVISLSPSTVLPWARKKR